MSDYLKDLPPELQKYKVNRNDFQKIKKSKTLTGGFGIVTFMKHKTTGEHVVEKKTNVPLIDEFVRLTYYREISILSANHHPSIVPFIGFDLSATMGYIYLKTMSKGSLKDVIVDNQKSADDLFDYTHKLIISYGIAAGMEFLHAKNVIHRDLKPENVLLDSNYYPYITDFGTSKNLDEKMDIHRTVTSTTSYIMAPEFIDDPMSFKDTFLIDVFSYGMTLFYIWAGFRPYNNLKNMVLIWEAIMNNIRPAIPDYVPDPIKNLIVQCWDAVPDERPEFLSIVDQLQGPEFRLPELDEVAFTKYVTEINKCRPLSQSKSTPHLSISSVASMSSYALQDSVSAPEPERESLILTNLRKDAENNVESRFQLAVALYEGSYGPKNLEEALTHFRQVQVHGTTPTMKAEAEYYLGLIYFDHNNLRYSEQAIRSAISHGNMDACLFLAEKICENCFNARNPREAENFYKIAADHDVIEAIRQYAYLRYYGYPGVPPQKNIAIEYFKKGSDKGDPEMMFMWSNRLEYGLDVPQNIEEAMKLLKLSADKNYTLAQLSYGNHLYSGYHIGRDLDGAALYYEKAALNGNATAQFYVALLNIGCDDFDSNFTSSINQSQIDACAFNGKLYLESGNPGNALNFIIPSLSGGSLLGFLTMGNLCEQYPDYGNSSFYYEVASQHCHSLDTLGFKTPIPYKKYHCNQCNQDMCEGCAKHCHQGHSIRLLCEESCFTCECGSHGTRNHCNAEYFGSKCCDQHLYQCLTCSISSDHYYLCKSCAENCHQGHQVVDRGIVSDSYCSCGIQHKHCSIVNLQQPSDPYCSVFAFGTDPAKQRWFHCLTCGLYGSAEQGICQSCSQGCHSGHSIVDLGIREGVCRCSQCKG